MGGWAHGQGKACTLEKRKKNVMSRKATGRAENTTVSKKTAAAAAAGTRQQTFAPGEEEPPQPSWLVAAVVAVIMGAVIIYHRSQGEVRKIRDDISIIECFDSTAVVLAAKHYADI